MPCGLGRSSRGRRRPRLIRPMGEDRFFQLPVSIAARSDLSPAAKLTYAVVSSYARMESGAHPAQATIGHALSFGERHVRNALKALISAGLVEAQQRGSFRSNAYRLTTTESNSGRNDHSGRNESSSWNDRASTRRNDHSGHAGTDVPPNKGREQINRASSGVTTPEAERLEWLGRTLGAFCNRLGPPEGAMLQKIAAGVQGASEDDIEAALQAMFDADAPTRMRSWAFMVKALPEEVEKLR